ncbi:Glycosyl transferase [Senna tora]|uniref:Glycosyl transferase n=1 Tax=Senna tora TaxID=362788 RepID=A0A834WQS0_9FABA|nr:Glycosyl transferase [Senna tora]
MGSLESVFPVKKGSSLGSRSSRKEGHPFSQRFRSSFSRLLFKKLDYIQWICTVAVFLFFIVVFQMFLPTSVVEKSEDSLRAAKMLSGTLLHYKDIEKYVLDIEEGTRFLPKISEKFRVESSSEANLFNRTVQRFGYRKPQLALLSGELLVDSQQLLLVTIASALLDIGYTIQVFSLKNGPVHDAWINLGVSVTVIQTCDKLENIVDWLNYDGIIMNSLEVKGAFSCFLQEPFKAIPLIWIIHENALAYRSRKYATYGKVELLNDWRRAFNRSTVVVFPNYALPMLYSMFDAGNFYVIPGSPAEPLEADAFMASQKDNLRTEMGYGPEDLIIAIVGSQFLYKGSWLGHAIVLQALSPLLADFPLSKDNSSGHLQIVVHTGESTTNYSAALETMAHTLKYPRGTIKHITGELNEDSVLGTADIVIYGSFLEEQSFPEILVKAMCFGKPIIAPDIPAIRKYSFPFIGVLASKYGFSLSLSSSFVPLISSHGQLKVFILVLSQACLHDPYIDPGISQTLANRVNGYLFPKDNSRVLTQIVLEVILEGKISPLARNIASIGKDTAKNLLVSEAIEGYASLLQNVLRLPSEVALPKAVSEISPNLKEQWQWHLFEAVSNLTYQNRTSRSYTYLDKYEEQWNHSQKGRSSSTVSDHDSALYRIWEEEKNIQMAITRRRREEELLKDRIEQSRGTWEEVYRSAKRADRSKHDLHERDEGELERTGQPLTIYEPYFGEGAWPFLHDRSVYRGIGLSTKGRRPGRDDVDAPSRLPLLNNPYYRDILGEYGAFFAIANRIDRIHKNAWIGFQSWRATARKASLSRKAENALLDAIQSQMYGDALYFWVRMDKDPRNPLQKDFWSFCDAVNAGNCKFAFSEALRRMYGIKDDLDSLPPMPGDGNTWSVMQSWALPTRSFLEFVMFSRMFVDALDAQMYGAHRSSGRCYLSLSKDKHCYSRLLELLVNVWAYHSARKMVYVDPETGVMQEQHNFKNRRGNMWIKWFSYTTLKSMDEDLAELSDSKATSGHWLWPSTGEVYWHGVYERERNLRHKEKEKRKQKSMEKQIRMRKRHRQQVIGKYVKPLPEEEEGSSSNTTKVS